MIINTVILLWWIEYSALLALCVSAHHVHAWYFCGADATAAQTWLGQFECRLLRYHAGSLALGSTVIMIVRPLRWLLTPFRFPASAGGNPCVVMISSACCCC